MSNSKKIRSFVVIAGALLSQKQNPCQALKKRIKPTRKSRRGNCIVPIVRSLINSGVHAYNAEPLSDGRSLLRRRKSLRSLGEASWKKNFLRGPPPRNKKAENLVGNSFARLVRLSTNAGLLV
jgi:hypothetical protein